MDRQEAFAELRSDVQERQWGAMGMPDGAVLVVDHTLSTPRTFRWRDTRPQEGWLACPTCQRRVESDGTRARRYCTGRQGRAHAPALMTITKEKQ